jgi:mannan endo-1,4-beta-mannosidase
VANHGSLVASFEKVKEMFKGKKLVTLSENGSVPYPDNLAGDGAGWSYFMPWNLDYTMDGWAHDNTADDWKLILNNDYVITLDKMPGWSKYSVKVNSSMPHSTRNISISYGHGVLDLTLLNEKADAVDIYNLRGAHISTLNKGILNEGSYHFNLNNIAKGMYLTYVKSANSSKIAVTPVFVK